ncbi:hypothetical protein GmHk_13G036549 [Glycine max]|nr:hypothetical protein GmHk_13G036549 [Glycine max]
MHNLRELAQNRPIIPLEHFLEQVAWPEAQLPLVRHNEAAPFEPAPAQVEPMPAEPQSSVVNPPPSLELEVVPPSPPLIIISDPSSDEAAAPSDSPAEETADPPTSPVGGIADLSDSSSGEVVSLIDSPMASRKRARADDIPSPSTPAPPSATIGPDVQSSQTLVLMLQSLFQGQVIIMHSLRELAHQRPILTMEQFLEQVTWPGALPSMVEPVPANPQSLVANPPSPKLEAVPPSPPIIIISDSPSGKTAAPPDSPTGEAADLSDSLSGEVVALFDSHVFHLIDEEDAQTQDTQDLVDFDLLAKPICRLSEPFAERTTLAAEREEESGRRMSWTHALSEGSSH